MTIFVNLSNHPSTNWGEAQKKSAYECGATEVVDIPFPEVQPTADSNDILRIAEDTLKKLPAETKYAMVSGEFTLCFELVSKMQRRGIVCLAATTIRNVTTDENGNKVSRFDFVQFRAYSDLMSASPFGREERKLLVNDLLALSYDSDFPEDTNILRRRLAHWLTVAI